MLGYIVRPVVVAACATGVMTAGMFLFCWPAVLLLAAGAPLPIVLLATAGWTAVFALYMRAS